MTYSELSQIKTSGFETNHVIDDILNTARWAYTKRAFQGAPVTEHEMKRIREAAQKEGAAFAAQTTRVKAAMIRAEGYPVGKPGPVHFNCSCGTQVPQTTMRNVCATCGTTYDEQGWIQA